MILIIFMFDIPHIYHNIIIMIILIRLYYTIIIAQKLQNHDQVLVVMVQT